MRGVSSREIQIWRPKTDFVEQSSEDIWAAACEAVRGAVAEADIEADQVRGVGFDATCSLVALDVDDKPVTTSPTGNAMSSAVLRFMSPPTTLRRRVVAVRRPCRV